MTIIAAALNKNRTLGVIASDSAGSNGSSAIDFGSKLTRLRPDLVVGFAGTYLLPLWLRTIEKPKLQPSSPDYQQQIDNFALAWTTWAGAQSSEPIGEMLIVSPKVIHRIAMDGAVLRVTESYHAIGSGAEFALGSLVSVGNNPEKAVKVAVMAAIHYSTTCGGNTHVERVK